MRVRLQRLRRLIEGHEGAKRLAEVVTVGGSRDLLRRPRQFPSLEPTQGRALLYARYYHGLHKRSK